MKEGFPIRMMIVGLPLGLLLIGVTSMIMFQNRERGPEMDPNEAIRLEAASLSRTPVNRRDLGRYLQTLSVTIGERNLEVPDKLEQAAVWIESTLSGANMGYVVERQPFTIGDREVRNLIAELPGRKHRDEIVVVGAHYDTVPGCPGANDNGTGIAALLGLARALTGAPQERTVRFVAFVNEEPPYFQTDEMGSLVYARECQSKGEKIVAMMAFDTIGFYTKKKDSQEIPPGLDGTFPTTGNFLAFIANDASRYINDAARAAFVGKTGFPALAGAFPEEIPGISWSDHWSFWQAGYPAIMVTDTAPYRYAHYHKPTDTVDKLDLDQFTTVVEGLKAVVDVWANP